MADNQRSAKIQEWSERLARWEASNQSLSEFCREERDSPALFYYGRKRLKDHNEPNGTSGKRHAFHAVRLVEARLPERAMTVRLPGNIEIAASANPAMAERVLEKILRVSAMLKEHTGCCISPRYSEFTCTPGWPICVRVFRH